MKKGDPQKKLRADIYVWIAAIIIIGAALFFRDQIQSIAPNITANNVSTQELGMLFGDMPQPTQPDLVEPVIKPFITPKTRKMAIKRIPRISMDMTMPHPYWGECVRCHLVKGGAPAGSQGKTPVGQALERMSKIKKVGPPIIPNSTRPHPAAGRCIKCHDIVIEMPLQKQTKI